MYVSIYMIFYTNRTFSLGIRASWDSCLYINGRWRPQDTLERMQLATSDTIPFVDKNDLVTRLKKMMWLLGFWRDFPSTRRTSFCILQVAIINIFGIWSKPSNFRDNVYSYKSLRFRTSIPTKRDYISYFNPEDMRTRLELLSQEDI
jgi:hypothetical protein